MRVKLQFVLTLFLTISLPGVVQGQSPPLLAGTVKDVDGHPVADASVSLIPVGVPEQWQTIVVTTDRDGSFSVRNLPDGRFRIYWWKDSANVPNSRYLLFRTSTENYREVVIDVKHPTLNIALILPEPYGRLSLQIRDKQTNLPIKFAEVTFIDGTEQPNLFATSSDDAGKLSRPLPNKPIAIRVTAQGYNDWNYIDPTSGNRFIVVEKTKNLLVNAAMTSKEGIRR